MEDSFRVRVEKAFGSLASSMSGRSTCYSDSSLWCLSDDEIERRQWIFNNNRRPEEDKNFGDSNLLGFFASTTTTNNNKRPREEEDTPTANDDQDSWDIRSSIGLDPTLDYEEEEDQYDKVAIGTYKASATAAAADQLYMRDIADDYGIDVDTCNELPTSFRQSPHDPRANHFAAKLRLREDDAQAAAAGDFHSLKLSDVSVILPPPQLDHNPAVGLINPKPILKNRENPIHSKSPKRVRFQVEAKHLVAAVESCPLALEEPSNLSVDQCLTAETKVAEEGFTASQNSSSMDEAVVLQEASTLPQVPDYVRNPSRYTRYTLDSSNDMDEESNKKACMDFVNLLKKPKAADLNLDDDTSGSVLKSMVFTPKKKANDTALVKREDESMQNQEDVSNDKAFPVGIAAGEALDGGLCAMDEDVPEIAVDKSHGLQKPGRRYRTRTNVDDDDDRDHLT